MKKSKAIDILGPEFLFEDICLRDYFAGQALAGFVGLHSHGVELAAKESYDYADAMMAERKKRKGNK